jgi:hypothetical protein
MGKSEKFGFYLPSSTADDVADINQISANFRIIDEDVPSKEDLKNLGSAVSPTVKITEIDNGHKVSITDINGTKSFDVLNGEKGDDYVLTEADKTDIADLVLANFVDVSEVGQ